MEKGQYRKTVKGLYGGGDFEIRMIRPVKFMEVLGILPVETAQSVAEQMQKLSDGIKEKSAVDPTMNDRVTRFLLENGVASPKIWFRAEAATPDGQMCFADLGGDTEVLAGEIMNFSFDFRGLKQLAEFFRGARPGDPGLPGPALQDEAVEAGGGVQGNGAVV